MHQAIYIDIEQNNDVHNNYTTTVNQVPVSKLPWFNIKIRPQKINMSICADEPLS